MATNKITKNQIVRNMQKFVGKKVIIMEPNKNAGKRGVTQKAELHKSKPTMFVLLDDKTEIMITNSQELFFITQEIRGDDIDKS